MSLLDTINDDVANIFQDEHMSPVEALELWPLGVVANKVEFCGVWDEDSLPGTNETLGDGNIMNKPDGRRDRKTIFIEAPAGLAIQDPQPEHSPDIIYQVATGKKARVKRVHGRDNGMITILGVDNRPVTRRKGSRFG